jgi:predicted nucleic acid-binding protein
MQQAKIIDVANSISILAAKLSIKFKMLMADSIICATARIYNAIVWNQDSHFKDLEYVKYFKK